MAAAKGNDYHRVWTDEKLEELGDALLEFCKNDKSIHLAKFCHRYKKPRRWLWDVAKRNPKFYDSLEMARELMSQKMADAIYNNESNQSFGEKYLPIYDSEYKELLKWKADLNNRELTSKDAELIINTVNFTKKKLDADDD